MSRRVAAAAWLVALSLALGGCGGGGDGGGGGGSKRHGRDGGAAVVMVDGPGASVDVPTADEREPNNSIEQAGALVLGGGVIGTLDGETDVDVYRITVEQLGLLRATLDGIDKVDLVLELRDRTGALLARSDRGPAKTAEGVPNFDVGKGDYFLAVSEYVKPRKKAKPAASKKSKRAPVVDAAAPPGRDAPGTDPDARQGPSASYRLVAELVAPSAQTVAVNADEREPNGDPGGAREVLLGDTFRGYVGWSDDVDVWKLSLEGFTAEYSLDIDVGAVDGLALTVEILDGGGATLIKRSGQKGGAVAIRNLVPEVGPAAGAAAGAGYYYAKVSADRSNPVATYSFKTSTRLLEPEEEIEPNDDAAAATEMRTDPTRNDGVRRGFASGGDVDYYLLQASTEDTVLDVSVEPPPTFDASIEVSLIGGASVAKVDAGKDGAREAVIGARIPAGKAVLVKLAGKTAKGATGDPSWYQLSWALQPASAVADPYGDPYGDPDTELGAVDDKGPVTRP